MKNEAIVETTKEEQDGGEAVAHLQAVDTGEDFAPGPEDTAAPQQPAPREDTGIGAMVAMVAGMMCDKMAAAYEVPELKITEPETAGLTEAIEEVAALYDMNGNPWAGLALVSVAIVAPRYMMVKAINDAKQQEGGSNGDQAGHQPSE